MIMRNGTDRKIKVSLYLFLFKQYNIIIIIMSSQYTLLLNTDTGQREFTFQIDTQNDRTWVELQLIKMYDEPTAIGPNGRPVLPNPAYYDPSIHFGLSGSYFNGRWTARWSKNLNTYVLHGAFGNPGGRIPLIKKSV